MKRSSMIVALPFGAILFALTLLVATPAFAHCDGMDGPVVKAAQKALATGNVNHVLIWVQKKDEAEIKKAFVQTLAVRKLTAEAKQLADMYFFETLVRLHRAGEGEPYSGLKPAGRDLGPAIPAADHALATGAAEPVMKLLNDTMHKGLHETFTRAMAQKKFDAENVEAGREYVKAYVIFIHYVEQLYEAAAKSAAEHAHETNHGEAPHE